MSGIRLTWDIGGFNPEKHYIYRSASPISPSNLPTPIAEVGQGINQYNDLTITDGETYHYFVAAEKMGLLCPADASVSVEAVNLGPGPQTLVGGDMTAGFFGETTTNELITGDALAAEIGLTAGVSQFSTEPWLKFALDGNILYVAKKTYRHSISWDSINAVNGVYGTALSYDGWNYTNRLLTGAEADPFMIENNVNDPAGSEVSEWDRLIYKVHQDNPDGGNWAMYSDNNIMVNSGSGCTTWCQEQSNGLPARRATRGRSDLTLLSAITSSRNDSDFGWRPVLELQL